NTSLLAGFITFSRADAFWQTTNIMKITMNDNNCFIRPSTTVNMWGKGAGRATRAFTDSLAQTARPT
ncbi:MAG: hypothetical protein ACXW00_06105, partial [Methylobacter sp.]